MRAHTFGFVSFQRTGVRLLFCHADFCKYIENCFALDFQLTRQIVNSNFAHPPLCFLRPKPSAVHSNLMPVGVIPRCIIARKHAPRAHLLRHMHVCVAHLCATLIYLALADFFFLRLFDVAFDNGLGARDFCIGMVPGQHFAGIFAAWCQ